MTHLGMHVHQIVHEAENFQEHGESMLAHESQFNWCVEESLPELVVADLEATCACKYITSQFLFVGEHEMATAITWSILPVAICFHLARVEASHDLFRDVSVDLSEALAQHVLLIDKLRTNIAASQESISCFKVAL